MGAALLSLLGPLVGPSLTGLVALIAILAIYFGIKNKGVKEERERQETVKAKEVAQTQEKVQEAISQDSLIDKKVTNEIEKIRQEVGTTIAPSRPDKFRF
jgi:Flp pilus assembly protein TadB